MSCARPLQWATLVDYWAGDLDEAATAAVDEHVFACGECAAASARIASVTEALRAAIPPVVRRAQLDQMKARGTRVHENTFAPGERREVPFPAGVDLLVHRLAGLDLRGAERVAFRITSESTGALLAEVDQAPFEVDEGAVLVACQRHYAALPADTVMSVAVHSPGGSPRTATYTILHRFS